MSEHLSPEAAAEAAAAGSPRKLPPGAVSPFGKQASGTGLASAAAEMARKRARRQEEAAGAGGAAPEAAPRSLQDLMAQATAPLPPRVHGEADYHVHLGGAMPKPLVRRWCEEGAISLRDQIPDFVEARCAGAPTGPAEADACC